MGLSKKEKKRRLKMHLAKKHLTLKKKDRLPKAKVWVQAYGYKKNCDGHIVKSYRKKFHVDLLSAIKELQEFGIRFKEGYVGDVLRTVAAQAGANRRKKEEKLREQEQEGFGYWWDNQFSFIAGFTPGGAPFGTRWCEEPLSCESLEEQEN
jgi:hypothetical protein